MDVDQVVDRHAPVDERLDLVLAVPLDVPADAGRVVGHLVHHLAVGVREVDVVLEEIAVPVDVGHHQLLVDGVVAAHQVGVARVVVDDHLVDLRQPVLVALAQLLVLHAERPVRVARREAAVGRDLVQLVGVDDLEDRLEEVEPVVAGVALDLLLELAEVRRQVRVVEAGRHVFIRGLGLRIGIAQCRNRSYLPVPRNSLIDSRIASRSGMRLRDHVLVLAEQLVDVLVELAGRRRGSPPGRSRTGSARAAASPSGARCSGGCRRPSCRRRRSGRGRCSTGPAGSVR